MQNTATAATNGQAAKSGKLTRVQRGRRQDPLRFLIYSAEGTGKSTLAAAAPAPIFLDIEGGTGRLDVARYVFRDEAGGDVPRTYAEVSAALTDLHDSEHDFKTVVIDTVDRLESLLWAHICASHTKVGKEQMTSIESFGFGKGYVIALDEWRALALKLDRLRNKGMNVILLSHALIRTFKAPDSDDYDRYQLALHDKAAGFLKGWCDVVGFLRVESGAKKGDGETRAKGWSTGLRILHLAREAAFDAKGRGNMPERLEIPAADPWEPLARAIVATEAKPDDIRAEIKAETERTGSDSEKVAAAVKRAGEDPVALMRIRDELKRRPSKGE